MIKNFKYFIFLIVSVSLLFFFIIFIEWSLEKIIYKSKLKLDDRIKIEIELIDENRKLIETAKKNGYENYYYPALYDQRGGIFHDISKKYNYAPVGGKPNTKTFYCNEGYGLIKFKTDRYGLRNNDKKWDKKVDVLFIGDSFVAGACVKEQDTIYSNYEKITGLNSLNLASGGIEPFHYAALSNIFIPRFKPKKVFLVFYRNDNKQEMTQLYNLYVLKKKNYFKEAQDENKMKLFYNEVLDTTNNKTSTKNKLKDKIKSYGLLTYVLRRIKDRSTLPTIRKIFKFENSKKHETSNMGSIRASGVAAKKSISIALNHCKIVNCKLTVAYIPNSNFWKPTDQHKSDNFINILNNFTKSKSVDFIDASKFLDVNEGSSDYAPKGGHLSPTGYEKVAKSLIDN